MCMFLFTTRTGSFDWHRTKECSHKVHLQQFRRWGGWHCHITHTQHTHNTHTHAHIQHTHNTHTHIHTHTAWRYEAVALLVVADKTRSIHWLEMTSWPITVLRMVKIVVLPLHIHCMDCWSLSLHASWSHFSSFYWGLTHSHTHMHTHACTNERTHVHTHICTCSHSKVPLGLALTTWADTLHTLGFP